MCGLSPRILMQPEVIDKVKALAINRVVFSDQFVAENASQVHGYQQLELLNSAPEMTSPDTRELTARHSWCR